MTALADYLRDTVGALREPLALDRWTIRAKAGPIEEARASCEASPEYRDAVLAFDLDRFETGDDVDEMVVHEMTHCHTWPIHTLAEGLATALAESAPENLRESLGKLLQEQVREAAERTTTDVGQTYLRLLRRAGILAQPPAEG